MRVERGVLRSDRAVGHRDDVGDSHGGKEIRDGASRVRGGRFSHCSTLVINREYPSHFGAVGFHLPRAFSRVPAHVVCDDGGHARSARDAVVA